MSAFDLHQVVVGDLRTSNDAIPNIRCEVFLNRIDTTNLRAEVYDIIGTNAGRFLKNFIGQQVEFETIGEDGRIGFKGVVTGGQIASGSDRIGTISISEYDETWYVDRNPITSVSFAYYLAPVQIFKRRRLVCQHDTKGLLVGWRGGLNPDDNSWDEESVVYPTGIADIVFYPGLVFADEPNGDVTVREQLKAQVKLTGNPVDILTARRSVDESIASVLDVISFLEQRRCNWLKVETDARGEGGKGFLSTSYRQIATNEYSESQHIDRHFRDYQRIVPTIVEKWKLLEKSVRSDLDKAVAQMIYGAGKNQSIENQLVYWHSCLDILIRAVSGLKGRSRKSEGFSRSLICTCEDLEIPWNDLYPYLRREQVFSEEKMDFLITIYRNRIIHEGAYPEADQYPEVILENSRAKALVERLVMGLLGLYHKDSPVGKCRNF